jgi:hypothetical protein
VTIDRDRAQELDHMVRKMGSIASVFEMRADPVGNGRFGAFRYLMDAYVDLCGASLKADKDFIEEGLDIDGNEEIRERLKGAFQTVFGVPPGEV